MLSYVSRTREIKRHLLLLAFLFVAFTSVSPSAYAITCEADGGACRDGSVWGCVFPENQNFSATCPSSPPMQCCKVPDGPNDCTSNYGTCRSEYYTVDLGMGCPYAYEYIDSGLACSGFGQVCCVSPPNVGDVCTVGSTNGTCQLGPAGCGDFQPSTDCRGGTQCCLPPPPTLGSLAIPAGCTISVGASDCSIFISWSINNPVSPLLTRNGSFVSNLASSPGEVVTLEHGLNIFELTDGSTNLATRPSSASCDVGSSWDGAKCAAVPAWTLNAPLSCTIPIGQSTCDVTVSWSITLPVNPSIALNGTIFSTDPSNPGFLIGVNHGANTFDLWNNGAKIDTAVTNGDCVAGSNWDGSICAAAAGSSLNVPLGCSIPIGQSTCDIMISWNVASPVNPRVEQDGGLISTLPSSPGTTVTLTYGTTSLFDLWNNGAIIDTAPSDPYCVAGSNWDGSKCAAAGAPACTGDTGKTGVCRNFCNAGETSDGVGTCTGTVCCIPPVGGGACTGDLTGKPGLCKAVCSGAEDTESDWAQCGSDSCCVPKAGPPPGTCTGGTSGNPGLCKGPCNAGTEDTEFDLTCGPLMDCCVPKAGGGGPGGGGPPVPVVYGNPLKWDAVIPFLSQVMLELQKLIATLAIIMIVFGGLIYITSAGDSNRTEWAKRCIVGALIGLGLGIAAPMFFKEIADLLGWVPVGLPAAPNTLLGTAMGVVNFLLSVIGVIAIIMLVIGAFTYLTAAGDESRIDTGKEIVKYSVIGITVALAALVLIRLVVNFF
ncbi:MAG: pilin [Undibacterium sp.]